ncbi:MAG: cobalt ECF transporter T component CbiQ [Deltaproteobacteria bacterium]|nr:cobalt ECF transporter T component CbiQ [Deltaproteobacteria bacterium]
MIEEVFTEGNSLIHRLDPRVKVVVATLLSIVVAVSESFEALVPAMGMSLLLVAFARINPRELIKRVLIVNGFILFLWLFLPFSMNGRVVFSIGPLAASSEGIWYSTLITLKSNIILLTLMSLIATSSVFSLGRALDRLFLPSKLVILIFFTYRYIHVIYQEYLRLLNAIKIRGFRPANNLHTYKTYAYLVGMVLVKSHDRGERVKAAMVCRGFKGKFYDLGEFYFGWKDILVMVLMLLAVSIVAILEWWI